MLWKNILIALEQSRLKFLSWLQDRNAAALLEPIRYSIFSFNDPTFHVSKLKLATDVSYSELASKRIHIPTDKSHEGDYEVNKILDHDFNKVDKKWYYLISYKGYHELFDSTWEPREFLDGAKEIRDAYDKENGIFVDDQKSEEGGGAKSQKRKRKTN